jgi:RecA/RadA recombinase
MSLLEKLKKNSTIKMTEVLSDSQLFAAPKPIVTRVPALNIAFSGDILGGLVPGLTVIAGPSKHFKTNLALVGAKAYLDAFPDAVLLFYDSEFGSPQAYFEAHGIDPGRVIHTPIMNVEELKFDVMAQLDELKRGDRVVIIIDSIGNLASKKEVEDALEQKSVADMSRAKQLKSLFRMVTPHLTLKEIPMLAINHIYMTQEMYAKPVVSGGTGIYYSANQIFIIGRQQNKDGDEVIGYNFIINIEKSRFVREKSKIPIMVTFDGGISKWSGLLDIALESGHVIKPKVGWYQRVNRETGEVEAKNYRLKDTENTAFWDPILKSVSFQEYVKSHYQVTAGEMVSDEEATQAFGEDE